MLSNTTFDDYTEDEKKQVNITDFSDSNEALKKSVDYMPYGAIYFQNIDEKQLEYDIVLSVGENEKLSNVYQCKECNVTPYMSFPNAQKRLVYFVTELTNLIVRKLTKNSVVITQGFRAFPRIFEQNNDLDIGNLLGYLLNPFATSFLIPIFVMGLVKEKEERYLVMMKMNGMKSKAYYITVYITNLILSIISMICFYVAGYFCGMDLFVKSPIQVLALVLFIWANIQVLLSFVISFFFKKNGSAVVGTFLIIFLSVLFHYGMGVVFYSKKFYYIWPPFTFYNLINSINQFIIEEKKPYLLNRFVPGDKIYELTKYLIIDLVVLFILTFYLSAVIPQEYGSHLPWHLNIISRIKRLFSRKNKDDDDTLKISKENPFYSEKEAENAEILEDDDVKAERIRVLEGNYDRSNPLIIKNFRKVYPPRVKGCKPHVAVHSATFSVEEGVVFGLLGPNGAGKTTLIHSLIGLYTPTAGYAKLAGYNIKTDMKQVYKHIGICPQHDILWNDLTVCEHLLFYGRLKGIPRKKEKSTVEEILKKVGLSEFKDRRVKGLSGGEKRRLSIAIAILGNPKLIFLDEPTTGLDPDVRRLIWNIIEEISHGKTIVVTTHSMEEAEVLCHRVAIISHGTLRCCATPLRLKELYGSGFRLTYINEPEKYEELKQFIKSILPKETKPIRDLISNGIYEFIPTQGLISSLFKILESNKEKYGIIDWGISQSSLEEVFLSIISDDDANAS